MRIFTAIKWFFKILFKGNAAFADAPQAAKPTFHHSSEPAIQLLGLLQKEGRLIDFLMEDIKSFGDADIGAAVRDIHAGSQKVLKEYMLLERVDATPEGQTITIPEGFNPSHYSLTGSISTDPPYTAVILHGGWIVQEIKLPTVPEGADPKIAAPARVEVK